MADNQKKIFESKISSIMSRLIFEEIDNEKAKSATITNVQSNKDNSLVMIFVTFPAYPVQSLFELKKARSYLRKRLAVNLNIRRCPLIDFAVDYQVDQMIEWEKKFEEIKLKDQEVQQKGQEYLTKLEKKNTK